MRSIHIIGIAGMGMSATAVLLKEAGWRVTGSDAESYGPSPEVLRRAGISFSLGYTPENIPQDVECFMIGRNAKLAPSENAEVRAAHATGKPIYSFPDMLGKLTEARTNLVVAGSYGKSTTTSLVAHLVRHSGIDAGYFVGAEPVPSTWLPSPAALGTAAPFILEGDEYPSAHDDPRAKFLHLHPAHVLLISVVHDHVNVYPTFDDYQKPFTELLNLMPDQGSIIVSADEAGALALARSSGKRLITYGLNHSDAEFRAEQIRYGERTRFTVRRNSTVFGELETTLLGSHNVEDILGAVAYAVAVEHIPFERIQAALPDFPGVRRRLDNVAPGSKVPVLEGFGSSYEKALSAIEAVKLHFPEKPLVVVFEPHTFGWRNRANLPWYDDVFTKADRVYVAAPERQGAATHDQLSHQEILERIGPKALPYEVPSLVAQSLAGNELVLILTSGSLHGTLSELAAHITSAFPR